MQNINDIYKKYDIMPSLALHQLRVAAVAEVICNNITVPVEKDAIIKACLLHDMGNIIKFKLEYFPEFTQPEGFEYWKQIQDDYIKKYGKDEHHATIEIIKELDISPKISELVDCVGFLTAKDNKETTDFNRKICAYADMRVTPHGIGTLQDRLLNLRERYTGSKKSTTIDLGFSDDEISNHRNVFEESLVEIEKQIFEKSRITADYINDETVASAIELLKKYEI